MKRRLLMVAGMAAMLLATSVPVPGMARSTERFGEVSVGRKPDASVMREARRRNQFVMVAVELEGRPVAAYQGCRARFRPGAQRARKADLRASSVAARPRTRVRIERLAATSRRPTRTSSTASGCGSARAGQGHRGAARRQGRAPRAQAPAR